ncbi:MAG: hypothetical protein KIT17_00855 [Rubrivivax sp.]|nr:hypothetical protein [Rubrivivax sp.]
MSQALRKALSDELLRRHGYRTMEAKIKPVHIANALMRVEHQCVGRMTVLQQLFIATHRKHTTEERVTATQTMIAAQKERWGALGQVNDIRTSALLTKVLPLIRTLLGADGAAFGTSPDMSSFSSPTALTVTGDPSDDGAGGFVHRLWGERGSDRLDILNLLAELTDPNKDAAKMDDLSALLAPLVDSTRERKVASGTASEDLATGYSPVEKDLRLAATLLAAYERKLNPNPIATLQRIVLLAGLSVFMHAATRPRERGGLERRFLLLDASGEHFSPVAQASTRCVAQLIKDASEYLGLVINDLLERALPDWHRDPLAAVNALLESHGQAPIDGRQRIARRIKESITDEDDDEGVRREVCDELLREVEGNQRRGLDGYLRMLGIRSGFLYPVQKNPNKRLNPSDRTLEVLVMSTIDVGAPPVEYRDFLEYLADRWSIVVGGRPSDADLLSGGGANVPARALRDNSERFLDRLESLGLAKRLADTVAVVGLLETAHA